MPNQTSEQHPWFQLSASNTPGFENYYIWMNCPMEGNSRRYHNNWVGCFELIPGVMANGWSPSLNIFCSTNNADKKFNLPIRYQPLTHRAGPLTQRVTNATCISMRPDSPTSTTASRECTRKCWTSSLSGSSAASTASESMECQSLKLPVFRLLDSCQEHQQHKTERLVKPWISCTSLTE